MGIIDWYMFKGRLIREGGAIVPGEEQPYMGVILSTGNRQQGDFCV
jgi:hypothetical protein